MPQAELTSSTHESVALYNRAREKINHNRFQDAITLLRDALAIAPDNPYYLSFYGFCLAREREQYDLAVDLCRRALRTCPHDPVLLVNLGRVYRLKGDKGAAHRIFLFAWEHDRSHPSPATELSRMGIRRRPVIPILPRSHWCNRQLGKVRAKIERLLSGRREY